MTQPEPRDTTRPRRIRWATYAAVLLLGAGLAAAVIVIVDRPTETPPQLTSITDVNWLSVQINLPANDKMHCPSGSQVFAAAEPNPGGKYATVKADGDASNLITDVSKVAYGDLTGDGQPEAVLYIHCTNAPAAELEELATVGGQLLVVTLQPDKTLSGLAFAGPAEAQYLTFNVSNQKLTAKVWYELASRETSIYSVTAPAHTRTYEWAGNQFQQTTGRTEPLVLSPSKTQAAGSPVQLPAITGPAGTTCPGNTIRFNQDKATLNGTTYIAVANAQAIDLDTDGNDELLIQITCQTDKTTSDSIFLLRQGPNGFVTADVPVANNGTQDIQSDWRYANGTLTVTVTDRSNGAAQEHNMKWNGKAFDGNLGSFNHLPGH